MAQCRSFYIHVLSLSFFLAKEAGSFDHIVVKDIGRYWSRSEAHHESDL